MSTDAVVALFRPGPRWDQHQPPNRQAGYKQHRAFLDGLTSQGVLRLAGPFAEGRGEMIVLEGLDPDTVRKLVIADPWITQGVTVLERIVGWAPTHDRDRG